MINTNVAMFITYGIPLILVLCCAYCIFMMVYCSNKNKVSQSGYKTRNVTRYTELFILFAALLSFYGLIEFIYFINH